MAAHRQRPITSTRRLSPDAWSLIAIAAAVALANLLYLLGLFHADPLLSRSGLASTFTSGRLAGEPTIDPNVGVLSQALGHRAALDLIHLSLPWWNPYEGTGVPLAGEMQSAALFPPTLLTLLSNGQLYEHMLFELVAGVSTYLLLRRLSVARWAALAAGIAFALNGTFAWLSHASVNPVAFLPLTLLGVELAYTAVITGRRGGWWLVAVAGALSFYAGFPEVAYIDSLLVLCWIAWRFTCLGRVGRGAFAGKVGTAVVVGTLLSAPLLIAMVDYFSHADVGQHAGSALGSEQLGGYALPQLLLPYIYGPIFAFADPRHVLPNLWGGVGGYLSTSLLLFALLGLFSRLWRGLRLALFLWIALSFARIYGQPPLLGHVLGAVPGMSHVGFYRFAAPSLEFAVIVLAALGLDDLAKAPQHRRRLAVTALGLVTVVALAAVGARPLANQLGAAFNNRPYFAGATVWGVAVLIAAAAVAFVRSLRVRLALLALLLAGDALALFVVPELSAPRSVRVDMAPVAFLQRHLGQSRFFTLGPMQPDYGSYFGTASLNVNDVPVPSPFAHYVRTRLDPAVDPLTFVGNASGNGRPAHAPSPEQELLRNLAGYRQAGVSYVLTAPGQRLPESSRTFELVFRSAAAWIYHLAGAAPYFSASNPRCAVSAFSRVSVRLTCPGPTALIRRETYLPGWSAEIDGHSTRLSHASGPFQVITVAAGTHRVQFGYAPPTSGGGWRRWPQGVDRCCSPPACADAPAARGSRVNREHDRHSSHLCCTRRQLASCKPNAHR